MSLFQTVKDNVTTRQAAERYHCHFYRNAFRRIDRTDLGLCRFRKRDHPHNEAALPAA